MRKIKRIVTLIAIIWLCYIVVDFLRFPECYSDKWRYQLERDINRGDEVAIEYYNSVYVENGRILFDD